jgi:hypothetical protein
VVSIYEAGYDGFWLHRALLGAELTNRQGVIFRYLARLMMTVPNANIYTLMEFMDKPNSVRPHLENLDRSAATFLKRSFSRPNLIRQGGRF